MKRVHLVAGARPNFMKVAPVFHALSRSDWATPLLVHTGQHFSADMADVFITDLGLPSPHLHLNASGDTHAAQTAAVMTAYESACLRDRPDWVVVVGDVNSTLGACLAAKKLNLPVAHLEAGLRSGDRTMPEELNRVLVDAVADLLWTPSPDADENLRLEGISAGRIERVGNVMIDAYVLMEAAIDRAAMPAALGLAPRGYAVVTMHRPANVDDPAQLAEVVRQLVRMQAAIPLVFPVHPRTKARLEQQGLSSTLAGAGVRLEGPLPYAQFMSLVKSSAVVVTDSGGVQEETTYLGIPCVTVRPATERPITVTQGTNRLAAVTAMAEALTAAIAAPPARPSIALWDGQAALRVAASLRARCE